MQHQSISMSQDLRLQQTLAPQMRQSLEFLQVPALELRALIRKEIELNPVLEEKVALDEPLEVEPGTTGPDTQAEADFKEDYEKLSKLDDDWREYFTRAGSFQARSQVDEERRQFFLDSLTRGETMQEHLRNQLGLSGLNEEERSIALMLIGSLNDDGYLNVTLGELAETSAHTVSDLERILKAVQDLDPVGVGARDLRECLQIQLQRLGQADSLASRLIDHHLDRLAARKHLEIARDLGVPVAEVHRAAALIATLEPKPGRQYEGDDSPAYVVPEVFVNKTDDGFQVAVSNEHVPRVRISKHYRQLMEDPSTPPDVKTYVRDKIRGALFLIKSIHQRQDTIHRIASEIVRIQQEFFHHGVSHLKPLVMADVAALLGIHETTVSRAIAGKYMETPMGVFEMKYFFTPGYRAADGQSVSNKTIMDILQQMVEGEESDAPLSDQALADELKRKGYDVARRTVAKYREELKILPSRLRKN